MSDLRDRVIHELTVAPGWNKADATDLVDALLAEAAPPPLDGLRERIADAFHDALCPVSHHDRREVYAAAMRGETQPCRIKYDRIAAALREGETP